MREDQLTTIEPEIQDAILDILPNDPAIALDVMAQLSANMLVSIPADLDKFIENLKIRFAAYKGN